MPLRVAVVDDNYLVRQGVAALLGEVDGLEVVAVADDVHGLHSAVVEHGPDVVLTDIRMPPSWTDEGVEAALWVRREHPSVGVVVLSQHAEAHYALTLLENGAAGIAYLLKERVGDVDELVRAIRTVSDGGSVIDPKVVEELVLRQSASARSRLDGLTERELDVLQQIATGKNNAAVGRALRVSERAVEKHINTIFHKLGLAEEAEVNRRVMAVLTFLDSAT